MLFYRPKILIKAFFLFITNNSYAFGESNMVIFQEMELDTHVDLEIPTSFSLPETHSHQSLCYKEYIV